MGGFEEYEETGAELPSGEYNAGGPEEYGEAGVEEYEASGAEADESQSSKVTPPSFSAYNPALRPSQTSWRGTIFPLISNCLTTTTLSGALFAA